MKYLINICYALLAAHASTYNDGLRDQLEHAMGDLVRVAALNYGATIDEVGGDSDD